MRLFLIRHPQPEVAAGVCYGCSDLPLREPWSAMAMRSLLPENVDVVSSPLRRCVEFAAELSSAFRIDRRLTELDFGAWEMQVWDAVPRLQIDAWAADPLGYVGHGGESVSWMRERVREALSELRDKDGAWVTHAGVIKLAFAELLRLPQAEWLDLRFDYGSVSALEIADGAARELFRNRTA